MKEKMYIIKASCYRCKKDINISVISDLIKSSMRGPESFSLTEIKFAQIHAVLIKEHYSATMKKNYFANTCPNCNAFIGQHFLFSEYYTAALYGDYQYKIIDI